MAKSSDRPLTRTDSTMGWWPFSSSNKPPPAPVISEKNINVLSANVKAESGPVKESQSQVVQVEKKPIQPVKAPVKTPRPSSLSIGEQWDKLKEEYRPVVWPSGVSALPAFGLSALMIGSAAVPRSVLPSLPPRIGGLVFGAAFASAGFGIKTGDEQNGAAIATWWSLSHVVFASLVKSFRKEAAKKMGRPAPVNSPVNWALTSATIATGVAYSLAL